MTTDSNIRLNMPENTLSRNVSRNLRSTGLLAKWPIIGLTMFLLGIITFSALAYQVSTNGPVLEWDKSATRALHIDNMDIPGGLVEYVLFGFFVGREMIVILGTALAIYFLHKRFWREFAMVLFGPGAGGLIWYLLSRYFDRSRPATQVEFILTDPFFPSGHVLSAVVFYGLLAYLMVPRMHSRFWKWFVVILLTLFIVFVGFSRLLLGGHYVIDVIAGYAIGIAWAGLIYTVIERFFWTEPVQSQESLPKSIPSPGFRSPGLFKRWPILGIVMILLGSLSFAALGYSVLTNGPLMQLDESLYKELLARARVAPPRVSEVTIFGFFLGKQVILIIVTLLSLYFFYQRP